MSAPQLLTIKIGNSNIGFGIYERAELVHAWRAETCAEKTADEYASLLLDFFQELDAPPQVRHVALVSVVPALTATFEQVARKYFECAAFVVRAGAQSGIRIRYQDPRALGSDRLVTMVAAKARYGTPALVIDFGTATTFNALDRAGDFIGGAIAPGLAMQADALHNYTATLPRVDLAPPAHALATNTREALQAGVFLGYAGLVEGLIMRLRTAMRELAARVIATGGVAPMIAPYCPSIQRVDETLTLEGLRLLYEMNVGGLP